MYTFYALAHLHHCCILVPELLKMLANGKKRKVPSPGLQIKATDNVMRNRISRTLDRISSLIGNTISKGLLPN